MKPTESPNEGSGTLEVVKSAIQNHLKSGGKIEDIELVLQEIKSENTSEIPVTSVNIQKEVGATLEDVENKKMEEHILGGWRLAGQLAGQLVEEGFWDDRFERALRESIPKEIDGKKIEIHRGSHHRRDLFLLSIDGKDTYIVPALDTSPDVMALFGKSKNAGKSTNIKNLLRPAKITKKIEDFEKLMGRSPITIDEHILVGLIDVW